MKILFNTHPFAFQNPGGGEIIMEKLRLYLMDRGHQVDFFSFHESLLSDYDIVHHFSTIDTMMWSYYPVASIPFVLTPTHWPRDEWFFRWQYWLKYGVKKLFNRHRQDLAFQLRYPDRILTTTMSEAWRLQQLFKLESKRFTVLPNGVDLPGYHARATLFPEQFGVNNYLLFVGNITPVKNLHTLIKVVNRLDMQLVVIGEGVDKEYFSLCRELANKNVLFVGRVTPDSELMHSAYLGAKAVIIPSQFESCSLVGLEAAIRGKKVIITERGGTKDVFADYVWYLNPKRIDSIEQQILRLDQHEYPTDKLQEYVSTKYSWPHIVEELEKIYMEVLASRGKE